MASAQQYHDVHIRVNGISLPGSLKIPENASGLVVFAHGRGSSRFSPRNRYVAQVLDEAGLATLLFDLMTPGEHSVARGQELRFNIDLLSARLIGAIDWLQSREEAANLPLGLFGGSSGSAAALVAAAERPEKVAAVVSRGGRPNLAGESLPKVQAPTLLLVGGNDEVVLKINRDAAEQFTTECYLEIIPGASHLFEEPGKLEQVADLSRDWFLRYLSRP